MIRRLALMLICVLTLSGCLAGRSPDQYGYALVIGVDEGQDKPYYISMLIARGSVDEKNGEYPYMGVECNDLFEAKSLLESVLPYTLNFTRATALVFSARAAQGELMEDFLSVPLGSLGIRNYANIMISACRAEDYLSGIQGDLNPNVAKYQYSLVEYGEETGYIPSITLSQFYARAWNKAGDVIIPLGTYTKETEDKAQSNDESANEAPDMSVFSPTPTQTGMRDMLNSEELLPGSLVRDGGLESGAIGCAVFRGARLVGVLNGEHTQALLMAVDQFSSGRMRIEVDGEPVSVLLQKRTSPRVELQLGDTSYASISLSLYAQVDKPLPDAGKEAMEKDIGAYIEDMLNRVYDACRSEGADVFLLGKAALTQFTDTAMWEAYQWHDAYMETQARFSVDVMLKKDAALSRLE